MRDCTGRPVEDMGAKYLVLRGPLETPRPKRRLHLCTVAALVDTGHDVTFVAPKHKTAATHPQSPWNVRDGLRAGAVFDGPENLEMTGIRSPRDACKTGTRTWKRRGGGQVVWRCVSETQLHENKNSEMPRFREVGSASRGTIVADSQEQTNWIGNSEA